MAEGLLGGLAGSGALPLNGLLGGLNGAAAPNPAGLSQAGGDSLFSFFLGGNKHLGAVKRK